MATDRTENLFGDESVRAWHSRDCTTMIDVAQKISEEVLPEDPKLLMWNDDTITRAGQDE